MNRHAFLIGFFSTALLTAPFILNARKPPTPKLTVAPQGTTAATVDGIGFKATILEHKGDTLRVKLTGTNETGKRLDTKLVLAVNGAPPMRRIARMAPIPREVVRAEVAISLLNNEMLDRIVTLKSKSLKGASLLPTLKGELANAGARFHLRLSKLGAGMPGGPGGLVLPSVRLR